LNNDKIFFQNKKTIVSFVLSLFVFYIHFRVFSVFKMADGPLNSILQQLIVFTKVAVPLFFVISGALFYRDYTWRLTFKKWKNRFFTLCIPYLVWNTMWTILAFIGNYTSLGILLGGTKAEFTLTNLLNGVFLYGYFEPFWFIFRLIVLTAFCPVIYLLLKNKWVGLCSILAFYVASCFDFGLNILMIQNLDMVIVYLIGAWVGIHKFPLFTARKCKTYALIGFVVYILCCVFHGLSQKLPQWFFAPQISLLVTIISCGAFWVAFDYFDMKKCPKFMSYSFLMYALHSFFGAAISKILDMIMPSGQACLAITATITFLTTITCICIIGWCLDHYFPLLRRILTGK